MVPKISRGWLIVALLFVVVFLVFTARRET